jgi:hypothetical protein
MLKKEIKCGGVQQIEFGQINKKKVIKQYLKKIKKRRLEIFLFYIYINGKNSSSSSLNALKINGSWP